MFVKYYKMFTYSFFFPDNGHLTFFKSKIFMFPILHTLLHSSYVYITEKSSHF